MKKYAIYLTAGLAVCLASCDDTSDLGKMQINEELPRVAADCVTIAAGSAYDMTEWNLPDLAAADTQEMLMITTTATKDLPEGAEITYGVEFAAAADFKDAVAVELPASGVMTVNEIDGVFRQVFGMGPKPHDLYARYEAYVNLNGQKSIVGTGADCWQVTKMINVTPIPMPMEERYFLLGNATNWDLGKPEAVEMEHLNSDNYNIYDYPYFWCVIDVTAPDCYWKIAPLSAQESGDWDLVLGVAQDGDSSMSGILYQSEGGACKISDPGRYILRFNAMESTYSISKAPEALWTPGDGKNNWNPATSFPLPTTDFVHYEGYSYLGAGGFKLTMAPDWGGGDYGQGASEGWIANPSTDNIVPAADGFVHISVNTGSCQISYAAISSFSLIGVDGNWVDDIMMTPSDDYQTWTAEATVTKADNLEFKFRNNEGWDWNLGNYKDADGTVHENWLVQNGDNVKFSAPGKFEVVLHLNTVPYTYTITAK